MTIGSMIGLALRRPLAGIFLADDPVGLALAVKYMLFLFGGLPLMAVSQAYIGVYNGTGHTKYTFVLGVTRLWLIRIPLLLLFKNFTKFGSSGIWYAMLMSNFLIAFVGYFMLRKIDFSPKVDIEPDLT